MKRAAAALVWLAAVIGIMDPYACVQHSLGSTLSRAIPQADRDRLVAAARRALALVPAPAGYTRDGGEANGASDETAEWNDALGRWAALGAARADRVYQPRAASDGPPPLEIRALVNSGLGVPEGLASVGDSPRLISIRGAVAILVTTIGAGGGEEEEPTVPAAEGGRVALPLSRTSRANSLAIVRILVSDPATEQAVRRSVTEGGASVVAAKPTSSAGAVHSVTIELYGGKAAVLKLARRIPVASLRNLLTP